jgi:hypothetical protein
MPAAVSIIGLAAVAALLFTGIRHVLSGHRAAAAVTQSAAPVAATSPGRTAPDGALATVRKLTSGASALAQRSVLTPEVAAGLPSGPLFPAGTSFAPAPGSWVRSGAYAHLSGTLDEPGHSPAQVEVGLVLRGGQWLVTFEDQL